MNEHRPEPPFKETRPGNLTLPGQDFKAGELTPWQDLSRTVRAHQMELEQAFDRITTLEKGLANAQVDMLERGLKTLEGSLASLAVHVDNKLTEVFAELSRYAIAIPALQHGAFLKQEHLETAVKGLQEHDALWLKRIGDLEVRAMQLTAVCEGIDSHLETLEAGYTTSVQHVNNDMAYLKQWTQTVEQSQQTYDTSIENLTASNETIANSLREMYQTFQDSITLLDIKVGQTLSELHTTFQASIDALDAKFDEYMQYVRNTSHTTVSQGTRITQLETLVGQQRTMIETALRGLREVQEAFPEKFS